MKTAVITVKTEPELKRRAEKFARSAGMSLSDIVNLSLRQTVTAGRIVVGRPLVPNLKTASSLDMSLKDIKSGNKLSPVFNTPAEMDDYLDRL